MNGPSDASSAGLRLQIRTRIFLGFGVSAIALIIALSISLSALREAVSNASRYSSVNEKMFAVLDLDREVIAVQRNVQIFSYTGHESLATNARSKIRGLDTRLSAVRASADADLEVELVARLRTHLEAYEVAFESAVTERQLRYELAHRRIPKLDERLADALDDLPAATPQQVAVSAEVRATLMSTRANVFRYLFDPDYALLTASTEALASSADRARALGGGYASLADGLDEYRQVFSRVVQSTRAYLYLVGVVMAGEALELGHLSATLRGQTLSDVPQILASIDTAAREALVRSVVAGVVSLLLGALLTTLIVRSISRPLGAITDTLRRLARGEQVANIPGETRRDEIGVLVSAANAFKRQNERTEVLLADARDLTAHLNTTKEELERSNGELEQFVYTVSHDLKSPIVTSMGFIGMMRTLAARGDSEAVLSKLDVLERANMRMSQLTTDLLQLSRVGRARHAQDELADVDGLLADLVESLAPQLADSGATLEVATRLPNVEGVCRSELMQAFENLIQNAIKYGSTPEQPARIRVWGAQLPSGVEFSVRDEGPGIEPKYHQRVFGLFERLRRDNLGTGVGLTIVGKVMQSHGGHVTIDSRGDGTGCTFKLFFPGRSEDVAA